MKTKLIQPVALSLLFSCTLGGASISPIISKKEANSTHQLGELFELSNFSVSSEHKEISDVFSSPIKYGVEFSGGNGGTISYRNIVDLNRVDKEDNLVEFVGNSSLDYSDLNKTSIELKNISIRVSDAYDPNIYFEVNVKQNETISQVPMSSFGGGMNNLFYNVTFNGYTLANNSDYSPLENYTVAWKQSLFNPSSYLDGSKGEYIPTGFKFDNDTNQVLLDLGSAASGSTKDPHNYLLFDLDDPTDAYPDFKGFTTGEVYISFSTTEIGSIAITKIGNDTFEEGAASLFQENTGNLLTYGYDFENMIDGATNCFYPLPNISSNSSYQLKVLCDEEEIDIKDVSNFVPKKVGEYSLELNSNNYFGFPIAKEGSFKIDSLPIPLVDESNISKVEAKLFESFTIPNFTYSGGNGKLSKQIKVVLDEETYVVNEGETFNIEKKYSQGYIRVDTSDEIKVGNSFTYPLDIDNDVKRFYIADQFDTVYVSYGNDFTVPDYVAIDYSKEDTSSNNIDVDIRRGQNTYYLPGDVITNVTSDFRLDYISGPKVLGSVNVIASSQDVSTEGSLSSYYKTNENVIDSKISDAGVLFDLDEGTSIINQPLNVSTSDLTVSFCYMVEEAGYDEVTINFESIGGKKISITLKELGDKPLLYLNGNRIYKSISVQQMSYQAQDSFSLLGKKYYKFTLNLSGENKAFYNANMQLVSSIDKFSDGSSFTGFKNATTRISFEIPNHDKNDLFFINQISNQQFTSSSLAYGDTRSSYIGFTSPLTSGLYSIGSVVSVSKAYAYDVINSWSSISLSITMPDGNLLLRNADPIGFDLVLDNYGVYILTYTCLDGNGQRSNFSYRLVVNDDIGPKIYTNASYAESYSSNVYIYKAKAFDNIDGEVEVFAILKGPDGNGYIVEMGKEVSLPLKGKYTLTYYCIDQAGNTSTQVYSFASI